MLSFLNPKSLDRLQARSDL